MLSESESQSTFRLTLKRIDEAWDKLMAKPGESDQVRHRKHQARVERMRAWAAAYREHNDRVEESVGSYPRARASSFS